MCPARSVDSSSLSSQASWWLALAVCTLCAQGVLAQEPDPGEKTAPTQVSAAAPATSPAVVIETAPIESGPTIEQLLQLFRAALEEDRARAEPIERRLASGAVEVQTRYGRFCVNPVLGDLYSDLARSLMLASRCAMF